MYSMANSEAPNLHITTALLHESGLGARGNYSKTGFGTDTGGTAPTADDEATAFYNYAQHIIDNLSPGTQLQPNVILDTPEPYAGFEPPESLGYTAFTWKMPQKEDGSKLQEWEIASALMQMDSWRDQHIEARSQPGRHIITDHHIASMDVGTQLSEEYNPRDRYIRMIRAHSPLRVYLEHSNPQYYQEQYEGKPGADYFKRVQAEAIQEADVVLFPTDIEREGSELAIAEHKILSLDEIRRKSATVAIPMDISDYVDKSPFNPINTGKEDFLQQYRVRQIEKLNKWLMSPVNSLSFVGDFIHPDNTYMAYIGRLDDEKGIFDAVTAYAEYLKHAWNSKGTFAHFLVLGGLSHKPGNIEKMRHMIQAVRELPNELQEYFIIPNAPYPHEAIDTVPSMGIYPSQEEAFNRGEKQARAVGTLVALSKVSGHIGTNILDDPTQTPTAIGFTPTDDWTSYAEVFEAARHPEEYRDIAKAGYEHVQQFSSEAVCHDILNLVHSRFNGFLDSDGLTGKIFKAAS